MDFGEFGQIEKPCPKVSGKAISVARDIGGENAGDHRQADAKRRIEEITAEVEVGRVYEGTVLRLLDFGAVVSLLPGKDGMVHISQIANERVNSVADYLKEGQTVRVKVLEVNEKGQVRLSMKALLNETPAQG